MTSSKKAVRDIENSISSNIIQQFIIEKRIGKGAYGVVWKAYRRNNNQPVALKKIFDAFRNKEDAQRTFREVTYLKAFKGHPNIINLLNVHRASNNADLYLVFEYMDIDLHNYLASGNILNDNQVRFITFQVLKALKFIHSGNVVHRDIKPSNILLNADCICKIADFGLARSLGENQVCYKSPLTDYVATRWYRAPEILLGAKRYTKKVDIWSLGCVLAEMMIREPLFRGDSTAHQLGLIMSTISHDEEEEEALERLCSGRPRGCSVCPLKDLLQPASAEAIDLALKLLRLDPALRPTAHEALSHPYLSRLRSRRGEPILRRPVKTTIPDSTRLSVTDYRTALYCIEDQRTSYLPNVSKVRSNIPTIPRYFSSDPESIAYKTRIYEPVRCPTLSSKTCIRGYFQSKVSLRH